MLLLLVGFYATIIGKDIFKIADNKDINLTLCFLFLLITFGIIIIGMFRTVRYNKLISKRDSIKFRDDDKLSRFNLELFSAVEEQNVSYIISLVSIAFSLFSLINCFLLHVAILWFNMIVLILCLMFGFAPSFLLICLKLKDSAVSIVRDYIRTNLLKIINKVKTGFKSSPSKFHEEYLTIVNAKYFNYIIFIITISASLALTFGFEKTITNKGTYIILPIWFLFAELGFNYAKDHIRYKYSTAVIIIASIISYIATFIFLVIAVKLNKFQAIEYFTLFTSIAGVLFTYQQDFTKK